jgi:uncharacterized protein (UPF0335 family)
MVTKTNQEEKKGVFGGRIISERVERLPVELTDPEKLVAARKLAEVVKAVERLEIQRSNISAELNARKKRLAQDLRAARAIVESDLEERDVIIQVEEDDNDYRYVREMRMDTDPPQMYSRRRMREEEKQRTLPFDGESATVQ